MNFNISGQNDYGLQATMTDEVINLYGLECKLMLVEKINKDDLVFGDYSHVKTNSSNIHDLMFLPETSESWDNIGVNFSQFGMLNLESINLYFSRDAVDEVIDFDAEFTNIIGNLIVLPNNRLVEITDVEFEVPGINNLYTQNDQKNVYKFICKTYDSNLHQELPKEDIGYEADYASLDAHFDELIDEKNEVDNHANIEVLDDTQLTLVNKDEDNVFGEFN